MTRAFALVVALLIATVPALGQGGEPSEAGGAIVKKVLDNGLTVIIKPETGSGLVAIVAVVRVGAAEESIQNAGIGNFVANLILTSTRASSAERIAAIADEVGGNVAAQWNPDFTDIRAVTTSARFNEAMSLVGECLTQANFEAKWVEQVRSELLREFESDAESLFERAYDDLRGLLYEDSGYSRPRIGYERTIRVATPKDLRKFYSMYYVPNNVVISIVGDVTVEHAIDRVKKAYAGLRGSRLPINRGMPDEKLERSKFHAEEAELAQAYLMVGWQAPGMGSPDFPAMAVAANALGGGKGSIMFREIRQSRGLYDLGTMYPRHKHQSHVLAYVFIPDPYRTSFPELTPMLVLEDVKSAVVEQVNKLRDEPLSDKDLQRAKGYTIGTHALQHQHMFDRAFYLAWLEAIGVGHEFDKRFADEVEKVTAEDVQRVARKYFTNYAAVLLLPRTTSPEAGTFAGSGG